MKKKPAILPINYSVPNGDKELLFLRYLVTRSIRIDGAKPNAQEPLQWSMTFDAHNITLITLKKSHYYARFTINLYPEIALHQCCLLAITTAQIVQWWGHANLCCLIYPMIQSFKYLWYLFIMFINNSLEVVPGCWCSLLNLNYCWKCSTNITVKTCNYPQFKITPSPPGSPKLISNDLQE